MAGLTDRELSFALGGAAAGVISGFAAGFFAVRKQMQVKYEQIAQDDIEQMRQHYEAKAVALQEKPKLEEIAAEAGYMKVDEEILSDQQSLLSQATRIREAGHVAYHNIFDKPEHEDVELPGWDYAEEIKFRRTLDEGVPYIIHKDEFDQGELEYDRLTLTYFEGDDVLCDERDQVVDDQDAIVGVQHLNRFGHGSGDPNKIYIRNTELQQDIEVLRSEGRFAAEVHGFIDEEDEGPQLKHSHRRFDDE